MQGRPNRIRLRIDPLFNWCTVQAVEMSHGCPRPSSVSVQYQQVWRVNLQCLGFLFKLFSILHAPSGRPIYALVYLF